MPITKHHLYPHRLNQLSNVFKVLGCPARLTILKYLGEHGPAYNKELVAYIQLSQSSVSKHLRQLININLVICMQLETSMIYRINEAIWQNMLWLHNVVDDD
jgi:DNA-binding transcriptional ArsR family regulator